MTDLAKEVDLKINSGKEKTENNNEIISSLFIFIQLMPNIFIRSVITAVILLPLFLFSQSNDYEGNLPKFYKQKIHFGFHLGYNKTDFRVNNVRTSDYPKDTLYYWNGIKYYSFPGGVDSAILCPLRTIYHEPEAGFNLGIVCDVRLHDYIRLRCLPTLSFGSRRLIFTYQERDTIFSRIKKTESVFIMFPLLVKLQSKRMKNFSAYVIGGGSYTFDLQSDKNVDPSAQLVRLKRNDYYMEGGGGVDFYLKYFKLGMEIKIMQGLRDILYHDGSKFAVPINKLNSHIAFFTLTFEG
jgi:hypothetical protein